MSKKKRGLRFQAQAILKGKLKIGQSKAAAKKAAAQAGTNRLDGIYSWETYHTYEKQTNVFLKWCKENYKNVKTIEDCRAHVSEWLELRAKTTRPATVKLGVSALAKLYSCTAGDFRFKAPRASRDDIVRSRGTAKRDTGYSETKNEALTNFCKGTGVRRSDAEHLRGEHLWTRDRMAQRKAELEGKSGLSKAERRQLDALRVAEKLPQKYDAFVEVVGSKGGKDRFSPIIGAHRQEIIDRFHATPPNRNVWKNINSHADVHDFRREYATALYNENARDLECCKREKFWNKEHRCGDGKHRPGYDRDCVYRLRGTHRGEWLDKKAMEVAALSLGHNRISVIGEHYLKR